MSNYSEVARHAGVYASVCTGAARACVHACVRVPRRGNHVRGWYSGQTRVRGGGGSRQQFYNCRWSRCSARFDDLSLGIITNRRDSSVEIKLRKKKKKQLRTLAMINSKQVDIYPGNCIENGTKISIEGIPFTELYELYDRWKSRDNDLSLSRLTFRLHDSWIVMRTVDPSNRLY